MNSAVRRPPFVPRVDRAAPLQFLRTAYEADGWIAVLLKRYDTGEAVQRVGPATLFQQPNVQAWLRLMNARHFNLFVSVNALSPGRRSRTRESVCAIRHVFIEVDRNGRGVLATINARRDLPTPSYVLHSSPDRVHVFWRATGFTKSAAEELQKYLVRELGADPAATPCSQTTRLAGFLYKYAPPVLVRAKYGRTTRVYTPADFPTPPAKSARRGLSVTSAPRKSADVVERARRYLAALPPAVSGHRERRASRRRAAPPAGRRHERAGPAAAVHPRRVPPRRAAWDRVRVADPPDGRPRPVVWRTARDSRRERNPWTR